MARVQFLDATTGEDLSTPARVYGDDPEAPLVAILICDAGQFIDPDADGFRLMSAPEPPELPTLQVNSVGTVVVDEVEPTEHLDAIESLKRWQAAHPPSPTTVPTPTPTALAREKMMDRKAHELVAQGRVTTFDVARNAITEAGLRGTLDHYLIEEDFA